MVAAGSRTAESGALVVDTSAFAVDTAGGEVGGAHASAADTPGADDWVDIVVVNCM